MTTTRDDILVNLKIGNLEIVAKDCAGGDTPRRIAKHGAIGMDGEWTEDLGEDARTDQFTAEMKEEDWLKLDKTKRAGGIIDVVHPLFGAYRGRILSCPYRAGLVDHVDVTITVIEDGEHRQFTILPSWGQAAAAAREAYTNMNSALESLEGALEGVALADFSIDILDSALDVSSFGSFLSEIEQGVTKTWQEAGAAFDRLSNAATNIIDVVADIGSVTVDAVEYASATVDACYSLMSSARQLVDSIGSEVTDTWRNIEKISECTVDSVLEEYLGVADDDALETLLNANPDLVDLLIVPAGHQLKIPVLR